MVSLATDGRLVNEAREKDIERAISESRHPLPVAPYVVGDEDYARLTRKRRALKWLFLIPTPIYVLLLIGGERLMPQQFYPGSTLMSALSVTYVAVATVSGMAFHNTSKAWRLQTAIREAKRAERAVHNG